MTHTITKISEREYDIELSYDDENIDITRKKRFIGTEEDAERYIVRMDKDIRENNARLFPLPEPTIYEDEEML